MKFRNLIIFFFTLTLLGCEQTITKTSSKNNLDFENRYKNLGFALIYDENLEKIKKLDERSLDIFHKSLKKRSVVKITNPKNGNTIIANVKSNRIKFSNFYNSILSPRIAEELDLDLKEPYIEIVLVPKNSLFIAKKAKTFKEERSVAEKAPIDGIQINDLNNKKKEKKIEKSKIFSYSIKVADFYYKNTAIMLVDRIKSETSLKNLEIIKISKTKYRVLIGPFSDIKSLKESFEKIDLLKFENLEILNNA